MKKEYLVLLAAGCVAANAANVNYDLLGRKGSKMNSPMVYKNVDYSKMKKTEQNKTVSSLESASLAKTGMPDGTKAIEGFYDSRFTAAPYYFKKYPASGNPTGGQYNWANYKAASNAAFIQIKEQYSTNPNKPNNGANPSYAFVPNTYIDNNTYSWYSYIAQPDPAFYDFDSFENLYGNWLQANFVPSWFSDKAGDVGVFLAADNLPVALGNRNALVYQYVDQSAGNFTANPGHEVRDSRSYGILRDASKHSVVYVGYDELGQANPANQNPQVYIGLRNNHVTKVTEEYGVHAKNLDNFIYTYRTAEFVPSGNYGLDKKDPKYLNAYAQSANAISVGSVELSAGGNIVPNSTSTQNYYKGSAKPEVYNYSHFTRDNYDYGRGYVQKDNNKGFTFPPHYDGTEYAAAFTAAMVSDLLSVNPFYRWHPEVVKALLLTSDGYQIAAGLPDDAVMNNVPSYKFLVFDDVGQKNYAYHSRFWNGNIDKLKFPVSKVSGKKEIWFTMPTLGQSNGYLKAAIAWLNKGDDIASYGQVPQDFDLEVYGTHSEPNPINVNAPGHSLASSASLYNSFEKIEFSSAGYEYLTFCIRLYSDHTPAVRNGEVILGFNLATAPNP